MKPLTTLLDREAPLAKPILPAALRRLYAGDLMFPERLDRPYVIGNFVTTMDGVASFGIKGKAGGGEVSGFNEEDQFVMGLLRAAVDAVVVGSGTLHGDPGHVRISSFIYPKTEQLFQQFRQRREKSPNPLNVIVTGSGTVDLNEPTFHTEDLKTLIVTSRAGQQQLATNYGRQLAVTQVRVAGNNRTVAAGDILKLLHREFGVKLLLHEGGPTLFGEFLKAGVVDELFLTIAPQVAGRSDDHRRPAFAEGAAFRPEKASWAKLQSLKVAGSHLLLRYKFSRKR